MLFNSMMKQMTREQIMISTPGEQVPGLLIGPESTERVPAALLLHGLSSSKERMSDSIGVALAERGIASLAIDLPLHGAREGNLSAIAAAQPFAIIDQWKLAITDATAALDCLANCEIVDPSRLALVGYSLGAFVALQLAAGDSRVEAIVLAAGGDLPEDLPFQGIVRGIADPLKSIRRVNKPVMLINGEQDRTVTAAQARRLHDAAREPKTIRWYRGGHWPPVAELDAAAAWLCGWLTDRDHSRQPRAGAGSAD